MNKKTDNSREEFINSEGGNKELRTKLWDWCVKNDTNLVLLEPGCFDGGIKRWGKKRDKFAVVYDYDQTVSSLADEYLITNSKKKDSDETKFKNYDIEEAYSDAVDWVEYNTLNSYSCYNAAGVAPKFVYTDPESNREKTIAK